MAARVNSIRLDVAVRRLDVVPGDDPPGCWDGAARQAVERRWA